MKRAHLVVRPVFLATSLSLLMATTLAAQTALGTAEQRNALVDHILELTAAREAWSPVKEANMRYSPMADMEAIRAEVVGASTEAQLFFALVKLSNVRRDSHLSVSAVEGGLRVPARPVLRAPISVLADFSDIDAPSFFISGVDAVAAGDSRIEPGDLILTINGSSTPEHIAIFREWIRYSSIRSLHWKLAQSLPIRPSDTPPWLYGERLDLELEKESGERYSVSLPYVDGDELDIVEGELVLYPGFTTVMERFNFNVLRPDDGRKVVLLQWLDFEFELIQDVVDLMDYAQQEGLLEHMLVIDVTDSSGGSRGAYAIQRLVDRPFRTTFGNIRLSSGAEPFITRWAAAEDRSDAPDIFGLNESGSWLHEWARTDAIQALERGDDYTAPVPFKLAHLPKDSDGVLQPAPVHFSGPIAIIGGPRGGSHLDQFMAMFADNNLAFTIGMPTGGYSNTWEASEVLTFPGTDQPVVEFMWNIGHTLRPNGEILEGNPVMPEVYVPLTRENFRTYHRDLLTAALDRLARSVS